METSSFHDMSDAIVTGQEDIHHKNEKKSLEPCTNKQNVSSIELPSHQVCKQETWKHMEQDRTRFIDTVIVWHEMNYKQVDLSERRGFG